jgi:hypothetical protein
MLQGLIGSHDFIWTCCKRGQSLCTMSHWLWTCHKRGRDCAPSSAIGYGLGQILGFTKMHWLWTMNKLWVAQEEFLIFIMLPIESLGQGQSIIFVFDHLCDFSWKIMNMFHNAHTLRSSCPVRSAILTTVTMRTYNKVLLSIFARALGWVTPLEWGLSRISTPQLQLGWVLILGMPGSHALPYT